MRSSGILLHITSLPSPFGIGDLGPGAYAMADFLKSAGQSYWQVLPLNPTDGINGHSPYSCFSAFAGNPLLISPQLMVKEGFLKPGDLRRPGGLDKHSVDYSKVGEFKDRLFDLAFVRWTKVKDTAEYARFYEKHKTWLEDFALFQTAKGVYTGRCWAEWPAGLRLRKPQALAQFAREHAPAIERVKFIQFVFFSQWKKFKSYVNSKGVRIIGDIPIYVNYDSTEVWCHPKLFKLNEKMEMKFVSGCPPDYFSKTGQRWGNPVYDWAALKKTKYDWWARRIEHNLGLFDKLRIDHFRGFVSFWQIPAQEKFAVFGRWVKASGGDFFKQMTRRFSHLPLIAEDLGEITEEVIELMRRFNFPGMRVLMFAFDGDLKTNPHVPANYPANCLAYTGTHDNNTVHGWYNTEAKLHQKANLRRLLGQKTPVKQLHWLFIRTLMQSKANTVILPLSDVLGLGAQARMNTPATKVNNWKWRVNDRLLVPSVRAKLLKSTKESKRIPS